MGRIPRFKINYTIMISFFLGLFFTLITLYFRILRPRITGAIDTSFTYFKFFFYLFLIICFFLSLIILFILPRFVENLEKNANSVWSKYFEIKIKPYLAIVSNKTHKFYIENIVQFGEIIYKFIQDKIFVGFGLYVCKFLYFIGKNNRALIITIIFYNLPFLLISVIFMIETIITQNYWLFPRSPVLIIFPFLLRILLFFSHLSCEEILTQAGWCVSSERVDTDQTHGELFSWVKDAPIPEDQRTYEALQGFARTVIRFREYSLCFKSWRKYININKYKYTFAMLSIGCSLISFSTLLYLMLTN